MDHDDEFVPTFKDTKSALALLIKMIDNSNTIEILSRYMVLHLSIVDASIASV
jgi:hypothetical protein